MNIRIGIMYSAKELDIDLGDDADAEKVAAEVTTAMAEQSGMLWLTDRKGNRVGVAASKVTYVEVGSDSEGRRVGFSAV